LVGTISIPPSVERISLFCFWNCDSLSTVTCGPEWTVLHIENHKFPVLTRRLELPFVIGSPATEGKGRLYVD
jgi:hypothetical protein